MVSCAARSIATVARIWANADTDAEGSTPTRSAFHRHRRAETTRPRGKERARVDAVAYPERVLPALHRRGTGSRLGVHTLGVQALTDEDTETLWPRGEADVPSGIAVYIGCWDELRRLYDDQRR